jgi:alcohol dehydrogenase
MSQNTLAKTAVFDSEQSTLSLELLQIPELKDGEVLVKTEYCTLCRSDLNTFTGKRKEKNPTILGHEIVGRIAKADAHAPKQDLLRSPLSIGDRITWGIYASDPGSYFSKIGIPQKGDGLFKYGHEQLTDDCSLHGGLSQYVVLRKHTPIIKLSDIIPLKVAAMINCAVATVSGAFRAGGTVQGKKVLVYGTGMLGIIGCAMAKTYGALNVAAVDINDARLATAKQFGANAVFKPENLSDGRFLKEFGKVQTVYEFSGVPEAMEASLKVLDIGGVSVWVGATYPQRELKIEAEKIIRNIHTITGLHNYNSDDLVKAVQFIENNITKYPFGTLVEDKFTLEQVNEAFTYALEENPFRVGLAIPD